MGKRVKLHEAIKISVEIDPKDYEGGHSEPEVYHHDKHESRNRIRLDGGKFEEYVRELHGGSHMASELSEIACRINETVDNVLEGVANRDDKRESRTAQHHAQGKVLREWRSFLRELAQFEKRFKK